VPLGHAAGPDQPLGQQNDAAHRNPAIAIEV